MGWVCTPGNSELQGSREEWLRSYRVFVKSGLALHPMEFRVTGFSRRAFKELQGFREFVKSELALPAPHGIQSYRVLAKGN